MLQNKRRERSQSGRDGYCIYGHHPAIISRKMFEAVQKESVSRSNIIQTDTGKTRKSSKYSSKRKV
ncbi:MAG: recombinase family protein [Desulfitobacterium sp.]